MARRRLELLSAELAEIRPAPADPPFPGDRDGSGELPGVAAASPGTPTGFAPEASPGAQGGVVPGPGRHAHRSTGRGTVLAGWLGDRLPPTLQGRVGMSTAQVMVVVLLLVGALGLTGWWMSRAHGTDSVLPPASAGPSPLVSPTAGEAAGSATGAPATGGAAAAGPPPTGAAATTGSVPGGSSAAGTSTGQAAPVASSGAGAGGSIVVDVSGKVRRPGIATLPAGSRVVDAVEAAGGARRGVALGALNLARVLTDGEQILVGVPQPAGVAPSAASAPSGQGAGTIPMVNINTADQATLEELPGIGPVTARSILDFRTERGTFTAVDELLEVSGIGDATLAKIAPYVTL